MENDAQPRAALLAAIAPHLLAFALVAGVFGLMTAVLFLKVADNSNSQLILGAAISVLSQVAGFYYGSSAQSKQKDQAIGTLVAQSGKPPA